MSILILSIGYVCKLACNSYNVGLLRFYSPFPKCFYQVGKCPQLVDIFLPVINRLVEYPLDNIEFLPEGPSDSWCGVETRRCRSCDVSVEDEYGSEVVTDTWKWCGTRTMSMRMAVRLQRLAAFTNNQSMHKL